MKKFTLVIMNNIPEDYDMYLIPDVELTSDLRSKLQLAHNYIVNGSDFDNDKCDAHLHINTLRQSDPKYQEGFGGPLVKYKWDGGFVGGCITTVYKLQFLL